MAPYPKKTGLKARHGGTIMLSTANMGGASSSAYTTNENRKGMALTINRVSYDRNRFLDIKGLSYMLKYKRDAPYDRSTSLILSRFCSEV